jgi:hypothetical protein
MLGFTDGAGTGDFCYVGSRDESTARYGRTVPFPFRWGTERSSSDDQQRRRQPLANERRGEPSFRLKPRQQTVRYASANGLAPATRSMATGERLVGDAEFAPIDSCSEERQAFLDGLLAVKRLPILLVDEVNSDTALGGTRSAAREAYDPAPFEVYDDRVTARMLKEVVDAHDPPCRLTGTDNFRCQHGEDHKPRQNGDISLEEVLNDRIAPWK